MEIHSLFDQLLTPNAVETPIKICILKIAVQPKWGPVTTGAAHSGEVTRPHPEFAYLNATAPDGGGGGN